MGFRERATDYSKGDNLHCFWRLFRRREQAKSSLAKKLLTFYLNRMAHWHGGYVGNGAVIDGVPCLPHGLHGVYISRHAHIGVDCRIYQNVTIGETARGAPQIGNHCMIGAGAVIVGQIKIGNYVKIGAGTTVSFNVPDHCMVVAQPPRMIKKE